MSSTSMIVAYDSGELAAAATSITISGLNGDVDEEYELIVRAVNNYAGNVTYGLRFNNDSGTNYGFQDLAGADTTVAAARSTANQVFLVGTVSAENAINFSQSTIQAKSGYVRTVINKGAAGIATTTVTSVAMVGSSWNNTADNITSIVVLTSQANGFGIGSRVILLKKSATATTKTWEEIASTTLTEAATSYTFSGLTGNSDVLYRLRARTIGANTAGGGVNVRLNNDSGSNYGQQELSGNNTTAAAARGTGTVLIGVGYGNANETSLGEMLIYAKSGYVRTAISEIVGSIATTTVGYILNYGASWNNTSDEITSIVVVGNTGYLGIGTDIRLERLNL